MSDPKPSLQAMTQVQAPLPDRPLIDKITVKNLDFHYQTGNKALKNINLSIADRHVTAFIGPSGCGKSTLLRVLNRIYNLYPGQRATGEVFVDGENILAPNYDLTRL